MVHQNQASDNKSLDAARTEKVGGKKIDDGSQGLSRQLKSVDSLASDTMDDRKCTSSTAGGGCCGDKFLTWHASDDELEPGLCGPDGIIAYPNVKTVLCLMVVLQVSVEIKAKAEASRLRLATILLT